TEAVSSAANQTGQKVSSSNNKSHEAKAHTTSAASGSISRVSNTAVKSAASTENTNKATSVASSAVNRQATTTKKADINLTTVTASTPETDVWTIGDTTRPRVDVVDVASYQSAMTQSDYNKLKAAGVKTVIIKTTEGTGYTNPVALAQAKMANAAGLNVDFYHYATFNTADTAQMEATNMANFLVKNNVSKKVLLFADMEDAKTYTVNATANLNTFWSVLNALGYTNHGVYTSNTYLYRDAVIKTVGQSRVWRAQYPYTPSANNLWNTDDGAWQFSSTALLPSGSDYTGYIDVSICYNGLTEDSAGTNTFSTPNEFVNQYHWEGNKLYFYGSNGQPITGFRHYGNNKLEYYGSDHAQYRNRYLTAANNQLYYFGSNGDAITGLRHYGNNKLEYYGTDHIQYRNRFATVGNNKLYYFGSNGDAISKSQADNQIASSTAATPNTKPATQVRLMATSSAAMKIKPITYKIQSKQMTRNQYQWQGNNLYYYGNDGQPITGLRHYSNNKLEYYGTDHVQYRNRYASQGNQLYYFGSNGDAVTGLRHYGNNKLEYYGTDHVQYRNRYASQGNQLYYFGSNGDAVTGLRHYGNNKLEYYGTDHVQYRNRYASQGNQLYYFGSNGDAVTGLRHYGNNKLEYYGTDHVQYRNRYASQGNQLYYFGSNGDAVTGLRHYGNNKLEYYGTDHVQYRNRYASQGNQLYYFGSNGDAVTGLRHYDNNKLEYYGADHVQYRNRYYQEGNKFYYFGGNGDAITGLRHYGNNKLEYYGTDHVQYRNSYANVGNTRYYFGSNGDAVSTNRPQTEADIIGSMRVAQKAQQIVTVVQDGESTATLKLWQKQGDTWRNILISSSRIGNGGIGNSHEGSSTTPKGVYHLSFAFGKGATAQTAGMSYRQIKPTSYWIEDQNDRQYNTWQDRSWANNKNEHLIDYTKAAPHNQYELAVVMDNQGQNNGSGFFIHVKNQWPTEGCVSISLSDMRTLVSHLGTKAYVVDVQNQAQLKNY
ncbi:GH25 family lysozyme, partial [Lactiplantibacillus plantarum]|uniref:GH25 family lysozyme n=1 Tax=Lactiplantibacillus plantarum TaxID=1590 RepID=UPI003D68DA5E